MGAERPGRMEWERHFEPDASGAKVPLRHFAGTNSGFYWRYIV